jgi:hypothetical protein
MKIFFAFGALVGGLSVFYLFLFVAAYAQGLASLINPSLISVLKDVVGPVSAGFGGAVAGAFCAYMLQQNNESIKERRADIAVVQKTFFQLANKLSELLSLKGRNVWKYSDHEFRFSMIPALPGNAGRPESLDPRVLGVMVGQDSIDLLGLLYRTESSYWACFENISIRNIFLGEIKESMEKSKFSKGAGVHEIVKVVGIDKVLGFYDVSEHNIESLDAAILTLIEALAKVKYFIKITYREINVERMNISFGELEAFGEKMPKPKHDRASLKAMLEKGAPK